LVKGNTDLIKENPDFFKDADLLTIETSIDSLASDSPFFVALNKARPAPWTRYHNLIGRYQPSSVYERWQQSYWGEGDGVVDVESAQFPYAHSADEVDGRHMTIHQSAKSIWVVRQVLLQHLAEVGTQQVPDYYVQPGPLLAGSPHTTAHETGDLRAAAPAGRLDVPARNTALPLKGTGPAAGVQPIGVQEVPTGGQKFLPAIFNAEDPR
jgi:hypothetical protein